MTTIWVQLLILKNCQQRNRQTPTGNIQKSICIVQSQKMHPVEASAIEVFAQKLQPYDTDMHSKVIDSLRIMKCDYVNSVNEVCC